MEVGTNGGGKRLGAITGESPLDRFISPSLLNRDAETTRLARLTASVALLTAPLSAIVQIARWISGEHALTFWTMPLFLTCLGALVGLGRGIQPKIAANAVVFVATVQFIAISWLGSAHDAAPILAHLVVPLGAIPLCGGGLGLAWSFLALANLLLHAAYPTGRVDMGTTAGLDGHYALGLLQLFNIGVVYFYERRNQLHIRQLQQSRELAEQATWAKGQLLAKMSHELRTPMHGVLGIADILMTTDLTAAQRDLVSIQQRAGGSLIELIDNILDQAKLDASKLSLERIPFSIQDLCKDVHHLLKTRKPDLPLRLDVGRDVDWVIGDPLRVRQVLINLVGNAIKFTNRGHVLIRVQSTIGGLVFAVEDTGLGIEESKLEELFNPFAQADTSTARSFGGTGLGLSISAELVALMGGTLLVESELGRGSTFSFSLPLPSTEPPSHYERAAIQEDRATSRSLRVLIIDDSPMNLRVLSRMAEALGHLPATAADGHTALDKLATQHFDIVLTDYHMPVLNGLETAQRARAQGYEGPIIATTADTSSAALAACAHAGMNDVLNKPVKLADLAETLARHTSPESQGRPSQHEPATQNRPVV